MNIKEKYELAKDQYEKWGINVDEVLENLNKVKISVHCWQGDDVKGFEIVQNGLSGGIQCNSNYLGAAGSAEELREDLDKALSLIPGKHKVNLHAIYLESNGEFVERDEIKPEHFANWVNLAKERGLGLDFNPTIFSHQKAADGYKDIPSDRLGPRARLKDSLEQIYAVKTDKNHNLDCVESKVFGIGAESYTVGSNEFYLNFAARNGIMSLMDTGHYHPTEAVSDKISAMLTPNELLKKLQDEGNFTERLALMEEFKTYPIGDIWNYYCEKNNVPVGEMWIQEVKRYEKQVLSKRY